MNFSPDAAAASPQTSDAFIKDGGALSFNEDVIRASYEVPVIVDLWAPWCGPCKQVTPLLEKVVRAAAGRARLVKINIDENPEIAQQLRIHSVPTVCAFADGQPRDGFATARAGSEINTFIERIIGGAAAKLGPIDEALGHGEATAVSGGPVHDGADDCAGDVPEPGETRKRLLDTLDLRAEPAIKLGPINEALGHVEAMSDGADPTHDGAVPEPGETQKWSLDALDARAETAMMLRHIVKRTNQLLQSKMDAIKVIAAAIADAERPLREGSAWRDGFGFSADEVRHLKQQQLSPDRAAYHGFSANRLMTLKDNVTSIKPVKMTLGDTMVFAVVAFGIFVIGGTVIGGIVSLFSGPHADAIVILALLGAVGSIIYPFGVTIVRRNRREEIAQRFAELNAWSREAMNDLENDFRAKLPKMKEAFRKLQNTAALSGTSFDEAWEAWEGWLPAGSVAHVVRFGQLTIPDQDLRQRFPVAELPALPALASFVGGRGMMFTASGAVKARAVEAVQGVVLRLLATLPPGKLRLTFIDPVGLGQNVSAFMSLGDHEEDLIASRAWTEPAHIEQRLTELTQHMETVIQKYLRTDYVSIEDYNQDAGKVTEAYRVLVVIDFPVNFSETAARRLVSIAQNGPRCGVYPLIVADTAKPLPYGFELEELARHLSVIREEDGRPVWQDEDFRAWHLELDRAPPAELVARVVADVGARAAEGMRVSVPYTDLLEDTGLIPWQQSSARELRIPLGPSGARKYQPLALGQGMAHHALVVGQPGSGKSNLLHVIIATLGLAYDPEEIQLYLIDFKQGVEFKLYAEAALPHARVIAIESEREFGLSVLRGLLAEMQRRGEVFRAAGVPNLSDYRAKTSERMPRILLLVDEFRVFFVADDAIASEATMIFDRLVSQGRAFGIHVILASQTLAGSYSLPRSTLDQMAVRIVLPCSEADSRLALADDNPEARLLSRPGEAIYNDERGLIEGNHRFQVADMGDDSARERLLREQLVPLVERDARSFPQPVVFEGHLPAHLDHCEPLNELLGAPDWPLAQRYVDAWLGEPLALRPPTAVRLVRQSGRNVLLVMRDEAQAVGLMQAAVLAIAAQRPPEAASFYGIDMSAADSEWAEFSRVLADELPHSCKVVGRRGTAPVLQELSAVVQQRLDAEDGSAPAIYLLLQGVHRLRDLRQDEDDYAGGSYGFDDATREPSPRQRLATLLREGPEVGIHVLAWADTQSGAARVFDRRMMNDFALRVVGPMGEQDSLALLDETAAARLDKPHRLIKFDEERPGQLETFRPYVVPSAEWLRAAARRLNRPNGSAAADKVVPLARPAMREAGS